MRNADSLDAKRIRIVFVGSLILLANSHKAEEELAQTAWKFALHSAVKSRP